MILRTTKQIIDEEQNYKKDIFYASFEDVRKLEISQNKFHQKVWVGLDELKKEMPSVDELERDCEGSCILFLKKLERLLK